MKSKDLREIFIGILKSSGVASGFRYVSALVMRIFSQHLWEFVCIVGLIVIQTLLLGYSIQFNFANIINGGDTLQLLNPQLFIQRSFSVWHETGTGLSEFIPGASIFYATPLYLLNQILGNIAISTFIFFATLFSLPSASMFLLSKKIICNNGLSFFISVFYSLNLYTAIEFHTPVTHILYLFGVTPFLVLIFTKIESSINYRKKLFFLVIYLLLYLPLVRTLNMFIIYLVLIPLIGFIINFRGDIPFKRFVKYFSLISLAIFLVALPFLVPLIFNTQTVIAPIEAYDKSAMQLALEQKLEDSIRFVWSFAWKSPYDENFAGVLSYSFLKDYSVNPFLSLISYYPILIVFIFFLAHYSNLQVSDKYKVLGLLVVALLSLFIMTPSLTAIGNLLYENGINIFRSAWNYFSIPYLLCLSLILALFFKQMASVSHIRKLLVFSLVLCLIHSAYVLPAVCVYGKTVNQSWIVEIPEEYYAVAEFLNQQDEAFRILPLPLTTHWAGYTPYRWGYVGPDILYTLTDKPLIDKFHNPIAPTEYLELIEKLEVATPNELLEYCQLLNVKYILLRDDVDLEHPYVKVYNSPEYYRNVLENLDVIQNKHVFQNLVLYELPNYTPQVFLVSANVSGNSLPEKFFYSTYQPKSMNYLHFENNPITLKIPLQELVESFTLEITFALEPKNISEGDWQANNHGIIQTDLFKVAISPKSALSPGELYFFTYLKNGSFWGMSVPFGGKEISKINLNFKNGTLLVFLNEFKIGEANLDLVDKLSDIKIGSNIVDTERLVGKIYDLNFYVNGENIFTTQKLFSDNPDYVESETRYVLHLDSEIVEFRKSSPTKYELKLNNPSPENEFFLVFLSTYDPHWKAYYIENGVSEEVPKENHMHAFDYGNAWYLDKTGNYTIVLEYTPQKLYDVGLITSFLMFGFLLSIIIIPENKMLKLKKSISKVKDFIIGFKETKLNETYREMWDERVRHHGAEREALSTASKESLIRQFRLWLKLVGNPKGKTILDAGCGYGRLTKKFLKYTKNVIGIDISGEMLNEAKKYLGDSSRLHKGSITKLPFKDHSFDIVICDLVLMHLTEQDIKTTLIEFKRVLRSSGIILFSVPHRLSWLFSMRSFIFSVYTILLKASGRLKIIHPRRFTEVKLTNILEEVGLTHYKILRMRSNVDVLLLVRVVFSAN